MEKIILITNDDGITAKGLKELVRIGRNFGKVVVIAPDSPQSGMGHAITVNNPIRVEKFDFFENIETYICSGTPVDCVKIGINKILKRKPDLILSGINHGSNISTNVIYSGTMSAAIEAAMENIPSIGFSLMNYDIDADFTQSEEFIHDIIEKYIDESHPNNVCLNVNIPKLLKTEIKGIKVCRGALAFWNDEFDKRKDPLNKDYYWLTGKFENYDEGNDTDFWAVNNGYISIVPVTYDLTAKDKIEHYKHFEK